MKVLMVNNQLFVLGGSETYMFSVGDELAKRGNDVQYFGKKDPSGKHGNRFEIYAKDSLNPFSKIVNNYNVKQFATILDLYKPDVVHINLMYFVLTPAIINEAKKRGIPIVHTVHDPKIVCPNHRLYIAKKEQPCKKCVEGDTNNCLKNKCVKDSYLLSRLAVVESNYYKKQDVYKKIDKCIFPSKFMKDIHIGHNIEERQAVVLRNFSRIEKEQKANLDKLKNKYVLFFGRLSTEKGMKILASVIKETPNINYKIVGEGECKELFEQMPNCELLGFLSGNSLRGAIKDAAISVFPSIWYENCPMSIMESIALGTPVIGSNIGGIPELIKDGITGLICESSNSQSLKDKIEQLYNNDSQLIKMINNCIASDELMCVKDYVDELEKIYLQIAR